MIKMCWLLDYKVCISFFIILNTKFNKVFYNVLNDFILKYNLFKFFILYKFDFKKKNFKLQFFNFTTILKEIFLIKNYTLKLVGTGIFIKKYLNNIISFNLGYSHIINIKFPDNIYIKIKSNNIEFIISSFNIKLLNFILSKILTLKKPKINKNKIFKSLITII